EGYVLSARRDARDAQSGQQIERNHAVAVGHGPERNGGRGVESLIIPDYGFDLVFGRLDDPLVLLAARLTGGKLRDAVGKIPDPALLTAGIDINHRYFLGREAGNRGARLYVKLEIAMLPAMEVRAEEAVLFRVIKVGQDHGVEVIGVVVRAADALPEVLHLVGQLWVGWTRFRAAADLAAGLIRETEDGAVEDFAHGLLIRRGLQMRLLDPQGRAEGDLALAREDGPRVSPHRRRG